jgi:nicotinate-nucleotide--dimethylbenzimidazole phosphoribosyltransferase
MADHDPSARASTASPKATLDEMRALLRELPGPDLDARTACLAREASLTKPAGALGRLENLTEWLSTWQGRHPPTLNRPRRAACRPIRRRSRRRWSRISSPAAPR